MRYILCGILISLMAWVSSARALLVVGDADSGGSMYTTTPSDGFGWDYVGHLVGSDPSSVTYVSNGWFVTAQHVWDNDISTNPNEETLTIGGNTYSIDMDSYTAIVNADDSAADLCMFRVTSLSGLPEGMSVLESTPLKTDSLRLVGDGIDNNGNTGMTWGNGTTYSTGHPSSTYTLTQPSGSYSTECYLSVYDAATTGSAYGQTYDSGGGVFVNGQLAGIMLYVGTGVGDGITYVSDFSAYGEQINTTAAIPEPMVASLISLFGLSALVVRRFFLM